MKENLQNAVKQLLAALPGNDRQDMAETPRRVAELWQTVLLSGSGIAPATCIGELYPAPKERQAVCVGPLKFHMVCPHHLTVATGQSWIAYVPQDHVAGFGDISELLRVATARLVLQEEAAETILDALGERLNPHAASVYLEASHPCQTLLQPDSRDAIVTTLQQRGAPDACSGLSDLILGQRYKRNSLEA